MTPRPMTRSARAGPTGLPAWLVQRASALYLLAFVVFLLGFFTLSPPHSYAEWKSWVVRPGTTLALALFFVALLSHLWVGLRDVLLDYARPAGLRRALLWLVALGLLACAASVAWLLALQHV